MECVLTFLSENMITDILVIYAMDFDLFLSLWYIKDAFLWTQQTMLDFTGCHTIDSCLSFHYL